jgi:hypothetical protein
VKHDPLQFVADSALANELALTLLIQTLAKFHPEITGDYLNALDTALTAREIPSAGAKQNIAELREWIAKLPRPASVN